MAATLCTSGPGATNFITGLYTAYIDSIPLIAITGQAVTEQLGKDAFQCVDIATIAATVVKQAWCVTNKEQVVEIFQNAFRIAKEGKPGPVLIDLPLDIQKAEINFDPKNYTPQKISRSAPNTQDIEKAIQLLCKAKNPVILMGGGVIEANAVDDCIRLAEMLQIPVITTYMAKGGIPINHPLNAGHVGIQVGQPVNSTWALIGHEKAATKDIDKGMFSEKIVRKYPILEDRIQAYKKLDCQSYEGGNA